MWVSILEGDFVVKKMEFWVIPWNFVPLCVGCNFEAYTIHKRLFFADCAKSNVCFFVQEAMPICWKSFCAHTSCAALELDYFCLNWQLVAQSWFCELFSTVLHGVSFQLYLICTELNFCWPTMCQFSFMVVKLQAWPTCIIHVSCSESQKTCPSCVNNGSPTDIIGPSKQQVHVNVVIFCFIVFDPN